MEKIWDITVEYLAKINQWIPLVSILWAGIGLIGVVLILAITGAFMRKRLVPQWLIWTYFTFSTIIIFAHAGNDIFTVVADWEIPCLVVLVCYILRLLICRRPRYTYVEKTVLSREVKGKKQSNPIVNEIETAEKQISDEKENVVVAEANIEPEMVEEKTTENAVEDVKAVEEDKDEENSESDLPFNFDEGEEITTNSNPFANDEEEKETTSTFELPAVEPIPDKVYEPTREPAIVTTPISERMPELKSQTLNSTARPVNNSINTTRSTTFTTSRPANTTTNNSFTSMYNPKIVKTTTTSTTTTTTPRSSFTTSTSSSFNPSRANANTTSTTKTTSSSSTTRSTEDILAAIERLRASMKK